MLIGTRDVRPFHELIGRIAEASLPLRFSLLIEGGGLAGPGDAIRRLASSFTAFSSSDSRMVRNALRLLGAARDEGRAIVRLRLAVLTWTARTPTTPNSCAAADACSRFSRAGAGLSRRRWSAIPWRPSPGPSPDLPAARRRNRRWHPSTTCWLFSRSRGRRPSSRAGSTTSSGLPTAGCCRFPWATAAITASISSTAFRVRESRRS